MREGRTGPGSGEAVSFRTGAPRGRSGARHLGVVVLAGLLVLLAAAGPLFAQAAGSALSEPAPDQEPVALRLINPDPALLHPAGDLWLAVGFEAPQGLREITFQWTFPDGSRQVLKPEAAGPSGQQGSAWYELRQVPGGTHQLTVAAEDGAGQKTRQSWPITVVGDLSLEPRLQDWEEALWVRGRAAQKAVDRAAEDGSLWEMLAARYGWRSGTDPIRGLAPWEETLGRITRSLLLRALVEDLPDGFLAQGVEAYERVRGLSYWRVARFAPDPAGEDGRRAGAPGAAAWAGDLYGAGAYAPEREAEGWPAFLGAYHPHPAADDAAYRLGRAHELLATRAGSEGGSPERVRHLMTAAWAYLAALELPDGDMAWDARNRLLYLLDAVATVPDLEGMAGWELPEAAPHGEGLEALVRPALGQDLKRAIAYALAVRHLSEGRYPEAAEGLRDVLAGLPAPEPWDPLALRTPETRAALEHQAEAAEELAQLRRQQATAGAAGAAYGEAAFIYRDPLLFHLALWYGQRADYLAFGHILTAAQAGEPDRSVLAGYVARHTTYLRALELFEELLATEPPEPWRERALFSKGMSLYQALHYGSDVHLWRSPEALERDLVEAFEGFAGAYPESPMADDALLMVGVYGRRPQVLRELIERYPGGDKRLLAERLLREME